MVKFQPCSWILKHVLFYFIILLCPFPYLPSTIANQGFPAAYPGGVKGARQRSHPVGLGQKQTNQPGFG